MTEKTCDYCGKTGRIHIFTDNESICELCIDILTLDGKKCRHKLHDLICSITSAFGKYPSSYDSSLTITSDEYNKIATIANSRKY